jgi:hypothetical protein
VIESSTNYLVSYGSSGQLGCFVSATQGTRFQRGSRVLVRSERGQEAGLVLCEGSGANLPEGLKLTPGLILQPMISTAPTHDIARDAQARFEDAQQFLKTLFVPLQLIDIELIDEPATVVLQIVQFAKVDLPALEQQLSQRWNTRVLLHSMTNAEALEETAEAGCGSCGSGCGSGGCGEGGGCSGGECQRSASGTTQFDADWRAYFAELRQTMERRRE